MVSPRLASEPAPAVTVIATSEFAALIERLVPCPVRPDASKVARAVPVTALVTVRSLSPVIVRLVVSVPVNVVMVLEPAATPLDLSVTVSSSETFTLVNVPGVAGTRLTVAVSVEPSVALSMDKLPVALVVRVVAVEGRPVKVAVPAAVSEVNVLLGKALRSALPLAVSPNTSTLVTPTPTRSAVAVAVE